MTKKISKIKWPEKSSGKISLKQPKPSPGKVPIKKIASKKMSPKKVGPAAFGKGTDKEMLIGLQKETFQYFLTEWNPRNGLVADKNESRSPCSIAANGLALSCYIVAVQRGLLSRKEATSRTLKMLRFFAKSEQSTSSKATGYKGFYYHFLNMKNGTRAKGSELSTIDTALFLAGALTSAQFFAGSSRDETEIRELANQLYERVDWRWAQNGKNTIAMKWTPEKGFSKYRWESGYNEAILLYVLAMGAPKFGIDATGYEQWISTFQWREAYGYNYIHAGPLFIHQLSHVWIDFREIYDDCNRRIKIDYFENSRRATFIQRQYAIENPNKFDGYGENFWGITSCNGPGKMTKVVKGVRRKFFDYCARGAPDGPDDGTVSPWVVATSLPFAPQIVCDTIRHSVETYELRHPGRRGLAPSLNPTFLDHKKKRHAWISPWQSGIDQGPVILMIENHFSGLIWSLMRDCEPIRRGLMRGGFKGGWLETTSVKNECQERVR